jgi:hypothetical protein
MIKAVLIDPYKEEITDITYDGNYKSIYPLIHCDTFAVVRLEDGDDVFVDDEGLLKLTRATKFFRVPTSPQPLAGYGLIVGSHENGDTVDATHDAAYYRRKIQFFDMELLYVLGYYK